VHTAQAAIIGAGPIGLEVAIALKAAGISTLHFDAGQIGSTMQWWAPQTRFFSSPERIGIAGVPLQTPDQGKATREEYLTYLRAVTAQFDLAIRTFERVTAVEPRGQGKGFLLHTRARGQEHRYGADHVVVAIGDMHRPRLLGVPGEDLPHVSHYFRDPHEYFRRRVLIVGGRNSAVEAAIRCFRVGAKVALSYRRGEFDPERIKYWLLPEIKHLIKTGHVEFYPQTVVRAITPTAVRLAPAGTGDAAGDEREVPADAVLALTGYQMDASLLEAAGVELIGENRAPKYHPPTMETSVPGLFVAGTAAAGTQHRFKLFIENCHIHAAKIVAAITGREPPAPPGETAVGQLEM
jgi:thioredoxin reductase (NADPH)